MSEAEYIRSELQIAFAGQTAAAVRVVYAQSAVRSAVAANPGAVGFLHRDELTADVKAVLAVQ